jgi:hypothetical protein
MPRGRDPDALPPRNLFEWVMSHTFQAVSSLGQGNTLYAIKAGILTGQRLFSRKGRENTDELGICSLSLPPCVSQTIRQICIWQVLLSSLSGRTILISHDLQKVDSLGACESLLNSLTPRKSVMPCPSRFMGQLTLARFRGETTFGLVSRLISTFFGVIVGMVMWSVSFSPCRDLFFSLQVGLN